MKIEVDGTLTFDKLIELASHGKKIFNNDLEEKRFPIKDQSKRVIEVKLLQFRQKDRYNVFTSIKENGFRSLFIEELLTFAYLFPDKQEKLKIITLDHFKYGNSGQLYPCLQKSWIGRYVGLVYVDRDTDFKTTRFAVTKASL